MPKLVARLTQDICIRVEQAGYAKNVPHLYLEFEKRIREVRVRNFTISLKVVVVVCHPINTFEFVYLVIITFPIQIEQCVF